MLKTVWKNLCFGVCVLFLGAAHATAGVVVGQFDSGNCYPFSCAASDGVVTYQQVYAASEFSGPIAITSLSFFADLNNQYGLMDAATYTISLSTTPFAVMGLDSVAANNIGGDVVAFGVFTIGGGAMPNVLTLTGNTFNYDPSNGNLLMSVAISNLTAAHGYETYFQADYTGLVTSRYFDGNGLVPNDVGALVTEFNASLAPVPEPGSATLLAFGFAGCVWRFARSRKLAAKST